MHRARQAGDLTGQRVSIDNTNRLILDSRRICNRVMPNATWPILSSGFVALLS
jgi:hypothetical protein